MSALHNPLPPPALPSQLPSPATPPPSGRAIWVIAGVLLLGLLTGLALWWKGHQPTPTAGTASLPTVRVSNAPLSVTARVSGQTSARQFANMTAPQLRGPESNRPLILIKLAKSGSFVRKGELVAQIDAQALADHVADVKDTAEAAEADIRKRQAEQSVDWENLQQTLRVAKADWDKAKFEAAAAEVRTVTDKELLQLAVDEAEARYQQLTKDLIHKKASQESEIRILSYTRDRHTRHYQRHEADVERFTMRAPMDGLAVIQSTFRGGEMSQIQEGDQVFPGMLFMKVVNPGSMQVEATINQTESARFRIGQPATVRLDAFPGLTLRGHVSTIGALAVGGWRQNFFIRTVPLRVNIDGTDPRLIPDLSASADVVLEQGSEGPQVPLAAIDETGAKPAVYVRVGDSFERREVVVGARSYDSATIRTGLRAGEEIALGRPALIAQR